MAFKQITRSLYSGEVELIFSPNSRNRYLVNLKDGTTINPPGVTTILNKVLAKEALMLWPMRMALGWMKDNCPVITVDGQPYYTFVDGTLEEAAKAHVKKSDFGKDVGSEVHEAIEELLNTGIATYKSTMSGEANKALRSFADWFEQSKAKVLATEQIVYSREHNYSGTFDALLEIDGQIVLCDIKTTNASQDAPLGIYPENFLQLGAYSLAHKEESRVFDPCDERYLRVDDCMVINASKQGKLSTLRASELGLSVSDCEDSWKNVLKTYQFLEPLKRKIKENQLTLEGAIK